jgi:hypothetical protein
MGQLKSEYLGTGSNDDGRIYNGYLTNGKIRYFYIDNLEEIVIEE